MVDNIEDNIEDLNNTFSESLNIKSKNILKKGSDGRFYCTEENCNKSYIRSNGLKEHILKIHTDNYKKIKCDFEGCNSYLGDISALNRHKKIHLPKEFICDISGCNEVLDDKKSFTAHKLSHGFWCNTCNPPKQFKEKKSLVRHINDHERDQSEYYLCPFDICPDDRNKNGFSRYDNMKDHVLKKHIKLCDVCWQAFNSDRLYSKHVCKAK